MSENDRQLQELMDLLADEASGGLSAEDEHRLQALLADRPAVDADAVERAAAAVQLAYLEPEPLPSDLAARLEADARAFFADDTVASEPAPAGEPVATIESRPAVGPSRFERAGWLAAAACLVLAVAGWWPQLASRDAPGPEAGRTVLLEQDPAATRVAWSRTEDPLHGGAEGEVVWSDARQEGYMTFAGLPANDADRNQYQLWIFDAGRPDETPVDGGVFDIPPGGGEVVVPIRAKLPVGEAVMFAITLEPPGGVVVSKREHLLLLAKAEG